MKKRRNIIILLSGVGMPILVTILLVSHIYSEYYEMKIAFHNDLVDAFEESLKKDADNRKKALIKNFYFGFADNVKKDSVTLITSQGEEKSFRDNPNQKVDEKYINIIQSVLYQKNPIKVNALNQLFHEELILKKIKVQTVVLLIDNVLDTTYWSSQNVSLLSPLFSEPKPIGTRQEVSLQAFTEVSPVFILNRMSNSYWFIITGWFFFVIGLAVYIPYLMRKTKIEAVQDCTKQLLDFPPQHKKDVVNDSVEMKYEQGLVGYPTQETAISKIPETPEVLPKSEVKEEIEEFYESPKRTVQLSKDLIFNFDSYTLYCKGEPVNMTLKPAKLLGAFLEAPNYYLSREDLRKIVWSNVSVTDEAMRRCISRLNEGLSSAPDVKVSNLPREGYRLDFPAWRQDTDILNSSSVKSVSTDSLAEETTDVPYDSTDNPDISKQT